MLSVTKFVYISLSDSRPTSHAVASRPTVNGYDHGFDAIPNNEEPAKCGGKKGLGKLVFCWLNKVVCIRMSLMCSQPLPIMRNNV
jgi:hypothetical protein